MSETAILHRPEVITVSGGFRLPAVPWRDPHTVSPDRLAGYIAMLEQACLEHPRNADLRTCLGMAHAMNYDAYRSMDALQEAVRIEPENFYAQLKYSELLYRLRTLIRAEDETLKALDLAANSWQVSLARKQLAEIRRIKREGTQKPAWTKSLGRPALVLAGIFIVLALAITRL